MITIGPNELVVSHTFLAMDDEEINFESIVDDWPLKITLALTQTKSNETPSLNWKAISGNHAKITFAGWDNSLGVATQGPVHLGETDTTRRKVLFAACNHRIGNINRIDFQLYLGGKR